MKIKILRAAGIATVLLIGSAIGGAIMSSRTADASRNAAGSYTLYSPGNPAVTNQLISTSLWNNTFGDIATALSDSLSRSGQGGMTAALRGADGSVSSPAYSWTNETGSGEYRIGAGDIGWAILGTKKLELSSLLAITGTTSATQARFGPSADSPIGIFSHPTVPNVTSNATNDGSTGWKYATSNATNALDLEMGNGGFNFFSAPAGTAGNAITFTKYATINSSGLTIGNGGTAISASYRATTSWTPGTILTGACATTTATVTGASVGADCIVTSPTATSVAILACAVLSTNVCTIGLCNEAAGSVVGATGTYACRVFNP